nr:hypothetical protein BaRGS_003652 [Batillaria attramentaria]
MVSTLTEGEDVCIVERLFSSSLVAIVSLQHPRKLKVCHFKKGTEICNYSYSNSILAVKLNRQRLIVCLEESLYIHNIRDMKVLHTIRDTPPNPHGLCALSISNDNCFLAYPGSNQIGEVQIFDTINLGTVLRVFSIPEGQKLFEFRRGVKSLLDDRPTEESSTWMGMMGQALKSSATYLPVQVTDMFNQGRSFATAHLPNAGLKNVCTIAT